MRYNETLKNIDILSAIVHSSSVPELELMQKFLAQLINLYDDLQPLFSNALIQEEINKIISETIRLKRVWENNKTSNMPINKVIVIQLVDLCRVLKTKLYYYKQVLGLGIQVKRMMTTAEKIKRGIRGDRNFANLPET